MGSSASKAIRTAKTTVRKYPTRIPGPSSTSYGSTSNTPYATDDATNLDASDPHLDAAFNARLAQLGSVQAMPTLSNSSTYNFARSRTSVASSSRSPSLVSSVQVTTRSQFPSPANNPSQSVFLSAAANPAVELLTARERISKEAEENFENLGRRGKERRFVDITTVRTVLMMRDELGKEEEDIEQSLGLAKGLVRALGRRGVISGGTN